MAKSAAKIVEDSVTGGLKVLGAELDSPKKMHLTLNRAIALIQTRTLAGIDMHGQSFEPYARDPYTASVDNRPTGYPKPSGGKASKSGKSMYYSGGYESYKTGIGRGAKVQLSVSNKMLSAIQGRVLSNTKGELFILSRQEAARAHGHHFGTNNLPKREFFGLTIQNIGEITEQLQEYIGQLQEKAGLN